MNVPIYVCIWLFRPPIKENLRKDLKWMRDDGADTVMCSDDDMYWWQFDQFMLYDNILHQNSLLHLHTAINFEITKFGHNLQQYPIFLNISFKRILHLRYDNIMAIIQSDARFAIVHFIISIVCKFDIWPYGHNIIMLDRKHD